MAVKIGSAANHIELWNTLLDFLQNDPALVAAGQAWTKAWEHPTDPELVLRGPGLSGQDEVLVGLARRDNELTVGESVIDLVGMTGVIPTATRYFEHVNALPRRPLMFLDQNPMQYWMVANGRRFVVVLRLSTVYQAMYAGLFLPYSNPAAYPYPLFIGGSRGFSAYRSTDTAASWRANEIAAYSHFLYSLSHNGSSSWFDSTALMLGPDGQWRAGESRYNGGTYALPRFALGPRAFPDYLGVIQSQPAYSSSYTSNQDCLGYETIRGKLMPGLNGEMSLTPITLLEYENSASPSPTTFGILDGCFSVPGSNNAAENIITLDGVDHLVVQNVQRTGLADYWALALE